MLARAINTFGFHGLWLSIAAAYLFVGLSRIDDGGTNSMARYATLRAMADEHTFQIDKYSDWTGDWARTPDGHYYSNKAPGPTLVAFPLFWVIDKALFSVQDKHRDEKGRRQAPRGIHKVAISTVFQLIPFLLLTLLALKFAYPNQNGASPTGYLLALLAILFGNTSAVLMSSYMGNPFAGMAMMGVAAYYLRGQLGWMSFWFGMLVLADYSEGALVLPFAVLLWPEIKKLGLKAVAIAVAKGAALPAFLWCWYHTACFGGPFSLPFKYDVQALSGTVENDPAGLWGKISLLPKTEWLWELLFGTSRGVLFTQPWILVCLVAIPLIWKISDEKLRHFFWFSVASFLILLSLNAGFPGWHGGGSPGPRYLCGILPAFGIFLPGLFDRAPRFLKYLLGFTVGISVVLRGLVYATWILPPPEPLWPYYLGAIVSTKEWVLLAMFTAAMTAALFVYRKQVTLASR